jgi:dolichyl-phosphate-mannose-protein mannosyltransferase
MGVVKARIWLVLGLLLVAGTTFRLRLVRDHHVPAGDGLQYWTLSQELLRAGRLAFGPPPAPLTFTRLPGFPLFLAHVAVRRHPADLETHLVRATRANALLGVGTGVLLFLILRERGFGQTIALAGLVGVVLCPLLFILASYGLSESLATLLATLEVWLALRTLRTARVRDAALVGIVAGAAQLVRADAAFILPAALLALAWAPAPPAHRLRLVAICLGAAVLVFAPWPVRNLVQFGRPYPAAWQWRTLGDGRPLPTGLLSWARTWATGAESEAYLDFVFAAEAPLDLGRPEILRSTMYDSRSERARVYTLFWRYNRHGLTPEIDAQLRQLAAARARRAPVRTFLVLPLRRLGALYRPVPEQELTMTSALLDLPRRRPSIRYWDFTVYALALLGLAFLLRPKAPADHRRTALVLAAAIVLRSTLVPVLVPLAVTQRFLAQVYPLLIALAAIGGGGLAAAVRARLAPRRARFRGEPSVAASP